MRQRPVTGTMSWESYRPQPARHCYISISRDGIGPNPLERPVYGAQTPKAGVDSVQVAVEPVLVSGQVSVEHVLNVINRLNQAPTPQNDETALALSTAPVADTVRYDRLRRKETGHA